MSSTQDFFAAIREAGTMQRLVDLLEAGPNSRVTEIAAKTLANLAVHESNQTAIRLSGGIPPLMRLLTLKPTDQARLPFYLDLGAISKQPTKQVLLGACISVYSDRTAKQSFC